MNKFNINKEKHKLWIKQHRSSIIKSCSFIVCGMILMFAIMYFSQARFSTKVTFDVIDARVAPFSSGDVVFAYNVDGQSVSSLDEEKTYLYTNNECTNGTTYIVNGQNWQNGTLNNLSKQGSKCTLYFTTTTYMVTIVVNGGTSSDETILVPFGGYSEVTITPNKVNTYYYLSSATCDNEYTTNANTSTSATSAQTIKIYNNSKYSNSTCTFNITLIPYSITYVNSNGVSNPTTYNAETNTFTLNNPTSSKSYCTFTGWSGTGISGTSTSVTIQKGSTGNRSYTANWSGAETFTGILYSVNSSFEAWYTNGVINSNGCYYTGCGSNGCSTIGTAGTYKRGTGTQCDGGNSGKGATYACTTDSNNLSWVCSSKLPYTYGNSDVNRSGLTATLTCP